MCSIRALYVLDESGAVLLSRHYATVERRSSAGTRRQCLLHTYFQPRRKVLDSGRLPSASPTAAFAFSPILAHPDTFRRDILDIFRHTTGGISGTVTRITPSSHLVSVARVLATVALLTAIPRHATASLAVHCNSSPAFFAAYPKLMDSCACARKGSSSSCAAPMCHCHS